MSTPHNEAKIGEIAKTVIMPGDPLRAKYIAENFLNDYKLVNSIRGMFAYTGFYNGKEITVMAHGMGMASVGIYSYELYKVYGVENIIRIGSCGAYLPELKLFDIVLSNRAYTEGTYALTFSNDNCYLAEASKILNDIIIKTAEENNISILVGDTACCDVFDPYSTNFEKFFERTPKEIDLISGEMEAFALFYNAKHFGKKASCLMSVVDSKFIDTIATTEERQTGLNNMIKLALDSSLKIN